MCVNKRVDRAASVRQLTKFNRRNVDGKCVNWIYWSAEEERKNKQIEINCCIIMIISIYERYEIV